MHSKRETEDGRRPSFPEATVEPLTEWVEPESFDSDECQESKEDLAAAQEAMEEYEAKGIEATIPYSQFRSKWLGPESRSAGARVVIRAGIGSMSVNPPPGFPPARE